MNFDEKLNDVFRSTFNNEYIELEDSMTADDIDGWDSVAHISLIFAIEEQFGITLSAGDLEGLKNVGDLRRVVKHKIEARG